MQKKKTYTDFLYIDSGSGGLAYLAYLLETHPGYSSVYVADAKNFPYGDKTKEDVITAVTGLVEKLLEIFEPKVIIIACNTISVIALDVLRARFSVPFVGTVPAIKQATKLSKNNILGLLATENTVSSPYTDALFSEFAPGFTLIKRGDTELVSFVEKSLYQATEEERTQALMPAITFFTQHNIDVLILACTHFIHLIDDLERLVPAHWHIIDSRDGVTNRALYLAKEAGIEPRSKSIASFYTTKLYTESAEVQLQAFLKRHGIEWKGEV